MATGFTKSEGFYLKTEEDIKSEFGGPEEIHSHDFDLKISDSKKTENISCDRLQTVLEAIESTATYMDNIKCGTEQIIVQIGEASKGTAIATHFPCSCLKDKELITLWSQKEMVEVKEKLDFTVLPKNDYCLFYIETQGGVNAKKKVLLKSSALKKFSKLCVYGTKEMTVKEAIQNDGRFSDSLSDFKLADITKDQQYIGCDQKIGRHDGKTFKICFDLSNKFNPGKAHRKTQLKTLASPRADRAGEALKRARVNGKETDVKEIYEELRKQFPGLREKMYRRFPDNTFQKALRKVDFGKAQQSFTDVYRLGQLLKLSKSVCKLIVGNTLIVEGTAFVLFNNYILTNAHLFDNFIHDGSLDQEKKIYALFNHESPHPKNNSFYIPVKNTFVAIDKVPDYAVLELEVSGHEENKVPPGLMKLFSPMPKTGEVCIIGHPRGEVKQLDPTCIIEKERRSEEVDKHCRQFGDNWIAIMSVREWLKKQGIENILMSDKVGTYHTFMYHGSSGSPVFNGECKVVGLHTAGFVSGLMNENSVEEIAYPVLDIFESFVTKLKDSGEEELLREIEKESKGNKSLENKLSAPELMDID